MSHIPHIGDAGDATGDAGYVNLAFNTPFNYYRYMQSDIPSPEQMRHLLHRHSLFKNFIFYFYHRTHARGAFTSGDAASSASTSPDKNVFLTFCLLSIHETQKSELYLEHTIFKSHSM